MAAKSHGKGFEHFMSKKDFHPGNWINRKRVWERQQKVALDLKREEEKKAQYEKEQELLNYRAQLGDEKSKLGLTFMYDVPMGVCKDELKKNPNGETKLVWQRKLDPEIPKNDKLLKTETKPTKDAILEQCMLQDFATLSAKEREKLLRNLSKVSGRKRHKPRLKSVVVKLYSKPIIDLD